MILQIHDTLRYFVCFGYLWHMAVWGTASLSSGMFFYLHFREVVGMAGRVVSSTSYRHLCSLFCIPHDFHFTRSLCSKEHLGDWSWCGRLPVRATT